MTLTQEDRLVDFFGQLYFVQKYMRSTLIVNNTPNGVMGQLGSIATLQFFSIPEHTLKVQKNNKSLSDL